MISTRERSMANVTQSFGAARTAANFKHLFAGKAFFTEAIGFSRPGSKSRSKASRDSFLKTQFPEA